jgi:hypothetical protein
MEKQEEQKAFTSRQRKKINLSNQIEGWGADLDGENRPGVPRDKAPYIGIETLYPDIERQLSSVKILKSVEHEQMPPVFGTTCPPKGLSGMLRGFAFRYSEGQFTHWLTLLLADRVDMVENIILDLSKGHVPNLYKEMGLAAEWKYNRKNFLKKAAFMGVGVAAATALVLQVRKSIDRDSSRA